MTDYYAEFVSVRRHILQCEADGKDDLLEKMRDHAEDRWVDGLQMSDDSRALLIHEPFGSEEVCQNDDGPVWMDGPVFDGGTQWMRDLAAALIAMADARDAEAVSA